MLSLHDFVGEEYYKWARQEYDTARTYLKHCGKPKDGYDKWLIVEARKTAEYFRKYTLTT